MKTKYNIIHLTALLLTIAVLATSCDSLDIKGMFFSSGTHTEDRVAEWLQWDEQHGENLITGVPDNYCFYVCSDLHITDTAPRLDDFLLHEANDPDAYFSIILGDLANEAGEEPYATITRSMNRNRAHSWHTSHSFRDKWDTCLTILGNHDIYFDCQQYYQQYFHTSTYTLTVQTTGGFKDLFIFLDSGNATHGKRQLQWLNEVLEHRNEYRHCIVCTHTCITRTSYNYSTTPAANFPEEEYYELLDLMSRNNVDLFLMGHFHHKEQLSVGGVEYVMTDNLNEQQDTPSYLVVTCGDNVNYRYEDL